MTNTSEDLVLFQSEKIAPPSTSREANGQGQHASLRSERNRCTLPVWNSNRGEPTPPKEIVSPHGTQSKKSTSPREIATSFGRVAATTGTQHSTVALFGQDVSDWRGVLDHLQPRHYPTQPWHRWNTYRYYLLLAVLFGLYLQGHRLALSPFIQSHVLGEV